MSLDIPKSTPAIPQAVVKPLPTTAPGGTPTPAAAAPAEATPVAPSESLSVTPLAGSAQAPQVNLTEPAAPIAPNATEARKNFNNAFGVGDKGYVKESDPKLSAALKGFAGKLNEEMKKAIGRNPRGLDFMHALDKAAQGKPLSKDDIGSIQLFLAKDTRYGSELATSKTPNGLDRKYGFRTHATLERLLNNFQPSDLVHDEYYARLDREGIPYAKYK
ncbi:MAG: hypothetical protein IV090_06035 [Candidatus Sericytochromatia bacterium]|nr:hypothetical protein [Candidatus Sericytochromatia bacterium]